MVGQPGDDQCSEVPTVISYNTHSSPHLTSQFLFYLFYQIILTVQLSLQFGNSGTFLCNNFVQILCHEDAEKEMNGKRVLTKYRFLFKCRFSGNNTQCRRKKHV